MYKKLIAIPLVAFSMIIHADELRLPVSNWGGYIGEMQLDDEFQSTNWVGPKALTFGFYYNRYFANYFNFLIGIDIIEMKDNASFQVELVNLGSGDTSTARSDVGGTGIPIELGAQYFMANNTVELGANLGFRYYDISRGIDKNCSNCPSDNMDVDNDTYLKPFLRYRITQNFLIGLNANMFFDDNQLGNYAALELAYSH